MHKDAMRKNLAQACLSTTISRSGMTDAELALVLGVNQSTISRLRHCKIMNVAKHQRKLDEHLGTVTADQTGDLSELIAMAETSPALHEMLVALCRFMRENA